MIASTKRLSTFDLSPRRGGTQGRWTNGRHVHRQPRPIDGRGAESRQDNCVRSPTKSCPSEFAISQTGTGERSEFLVDPGQQRCPHYRASYGHQPLALLRRAPRRFVPMGRTAEAGDSPKNWSGPTRRDSRASRGNQNPEIRGSRAGGETTTVLEGH